MPTLPSVASHKHAVAGGGTASHDHDLDAGENTHSHGPNTVDNPTEKKLLPFLNKAAMAEVSTKSRNQMADTSFAWVDDKGKGHFIISDASHVRNALARWSQAKLGWSPDQKKTAREKILAAAKKFDILVADNALPLSERPTERDGVLMSLSEDRVSLGEGRVPYLRSGEWHFDNAYGELKVGRDELQTVKHLFDERVRRQDAPVFFRGQVELGGVNEDHNPTRAVGWIKALEFRDGNPDQLDALVEFNPVGDQLIQNDQYRYSSAELLRNWKDAETGEIYPLVGYGLALSNTPRVKDMGYIAASENGEAQLLAFSEGPMVTARPDYARHLYFAEQDTNDPDGDGDDDGPVPPCVHQPGFGACPGFTRFPGDDDGDGVCLMATKGCNGYRAISPDVQPLPVIASMYSETNRGGSMTKETTAPAPGAPPAEADTAPKDGEQPKDPQATANAAENEQILASERADKEKAQTEVTQLSERVRTLETAQNLAGVADRLDKAVREFRLTPAQKQMYSEHMVELSEERMAWLLDEIEKREPIAVLMGEKGVSGSDATLDESERLDRAAKAFMSERAKEGAPVKYRDALIQVSSTGYGRS